ncbi:MAG: hypothetical protein JWL72_1221 [Ilumatobacteraceae bacterium]|nr:hypothetical protein [Ilumatobacteraceae bacterium]MCU1387883.1 hypothetical protein [Ilumatobacteraceae bacterium]
MTRVLQRPSFDDAPIDVPAPPSWDSSALAAYELGYARGSTAGRDSGRLDLLIIEGHVDRCMAAVAEAADAMSRRVLEVAELFVTTTLRHVPEARTAGLLVRLGEVLASFDPGTITLTVHPDDAEIAADCIARRPPNGQNITVLSDRRLSPGEFRLNSDWAQAEGTFDRYIAAAREALELHLSADPR